MTMEQKPNLFECYDTTVVLTKFNAEQKLCLKYLLKF